MTLFAVSDNVWLGLFGLLGLLIKEYFDRKRAADAAVKVDKVAEEAKEVKNTLVTTTQVQQAERREIAGCHNEKLDVVVSAVKEVKDDIHKVEIATNSMKDALVA